MPPSAESARTHQATQHQAPVTVIVAHNRYRSALPSGENIVVEQEMRWLAEAGVTVVPFLRSSDEIPSLSLAQKAGLPLAPIRSGSSARLLAGLIRQHCPQVLHLHNPYPLISPWIVRTARLMGVPVVQTVHNYRQVCVSGLYFRDGRVCHDCRGRRVGLPAIRHRCYRGSALQSAVMTAALAVHRSTWRSVDRFLAPTESMAAHLRDFGIDGDRIVVKPNAVDDPGPCRDRGHGALFAGRLSPEKGLGILLDAWSPQWGRLRVAGDGPMRALVQGNPAVDYLGPLDRAGVAAEIRRSAVVVVPSQVDDVQPTIVIEALSHGRPVLGTTRGGIPDLIGPAGWTVAPTASALAAAIPTALDSDLGAVARQRYLDLFTPAGAVRRLIDTYLALSK